VRGAGLRHDASEGVLGLGGGVEVRAADEAAHGGVSSTVRSALSRWRSSTETPKRAERKRQVSPRRLQYVLPRAMAPAIGAAGGSGAVKLSGESVARLEDQI
jgi:hypothetical protein